MTLHQLRILWAVAHAKSLTQASKQLGLAQPTVSQQIAKLEESLGTPLFDRIGNRLTLTGGGEFLLRKAETILAQADEAETGLRALSDGSRGPIVLGALNSIAQAVLPRTLARMSEKFPHVEIDVHELPPGEALDMLYGRQINVAVLSVNSLSGDSVAYPSVDVCKDPYVLATPVGLDLSNVGDVESDLDSRAQGILNRCVQFRFGSAHQARVAQWYRDVLPRHQVVAQVGTYEVALALVEAGLGVALVPALTVHARLNVSLYRVKRPERHTVALVPQQYRRVEPYATFLRLLAEEGAAIELPAIEATPPFLAREAGSDASEPAKVV
ncbi:MAG: LysR family transcriptional regulator [Proteobacteria bacterium]|nr:LysR family transcriptional regulator [Pseudomonadota bacterium]MDA1059178.1 LysR family transcriptional regulator [Pseudomonadota bacterium]